MSHEFDGLDPTEKAGIEGALNRCRALAAQIASELRNKRGKRRGAGVRGRVVPVDGLTWHNQCSRARA
jgi:hypothetical protein